MRRILLAASIGILISAGQGLWGQSKIPAEQSLTTVTANNWLAVTGTEGNGDPDRLQIVFFEVPDSLSSTLYFAVRDAGTDGRTQGAGGYDLSGPGALPGVPDQDDAGAAAYTTFSLRGGTGTLSSSLSRKINYSTYSEAYTGSPLDSFQASNTNDAAFTGPSYGWRYFAGVSPNQGEHIGTKRYFKVVVEADAAIGKNAFQLDVSLGNTGVPTGVSGVRAFSYAWTLALRLRTVPLNTWNLYPFVEDGAAGNLAIHNWDMDGGSTLSLFAKSGYTVTPNPARSGGGGVFPTGLVNDTYVIATVETASGNLNQRNGTWNLRVTEDGNPVGTDVNPAVFWASNSTNTVWDGEATDIPRRMYASPYFPEPPNRVVASAADGLGLSGGTDRERISLQIVDADGAPAPYIRTIYLSVNNGGEIEATSKEVGELSASTRTVITDSEGFAWVDISKPGAGAAVVTLTITTDGATSALPGPTTSSRLPATGTLGINDSPQLSFLTDANPTASSAAGTSFNEGTTSPALGTITITEAGSTASVTAANEIRITIPTTRNVTFNTAASVTLTVTNGGAGGQVENNQLVPIGAGTVSFTGALRYENGNKTAVIDVFSTFDTATPDSITIAGLQLIAAADSDCNFFLEFSFDGDTAAELVDNKLIIVRDTIQTYSWIGGASGWNNSANWNPAAVPDGSVNVLIPAGTVTVDAANLDVLNLTVASGATLVLSANALGVNGTLSLDGTLRLDGTVGLTGTASFDSDSGTVNYRGDGSGGLVQGSSYNNLDFTGATGTYALGSDLTVKGNLTIGPAGGLNATGRTITLSGSWTKGAGTFTSTGSTLVFTGSATSTIAGATTFNNLRCLTPGKRLVFTQGQIFTVSGELVLKGSSVAKLELTSSTTTPFVLNRNSAVLPDLQYLSVSYSDVDEASLVDLTAYFSTFGAGVDTGTTRIWVLAGASLVWTGTTDSDWSKPGNWTPSQKPTAIDLVTIPNVTTDPVLTEASLAKNLLIQAGASLDLNAFSLSVSGNVDLDGAVLASGGGSIACVDLTSVGSITNSGALGISASGNVSITGSYGTPTNGTITMTGAGKTLNASPHLGNLTVSAGTTTLGRTLDLDGTLSISAAATLDVSSSNHAVSVAGNWNNAGSFIPRSGSVFLNSSGTGRTLTTNGVSFYNLQLAAGTDTTTLSGALNVAGFLTIDANQTLDLGANNATVTGALSNDGVILVSSTGRPNKSDSDSGIVRYTTIGGVVTELGATDYFNLELAPASAGSFTTGGALAVAGALSLNTFATLDLGANNVTVSGALSNDGTILISGTGRPDKSDSDSGIVRYTIIGGVVSEFGATDYFNLELAPASAGSFTTGGALAVAGALTLNTFATLDLGANNVTVTGAISNDGAILVSGAGRPNKSDSDSGLVRYTTIGGVVTELGATDYFNLELVPASAGSFTTGGALAVAGALTLNTFATLDVGANNVTVSGAFSNDGIVLISGAGRPNKSDNDSGLMRYTTIGGVIAELGTPDYFNLELAPASAGSFTTGGALAVAGALTLNSFATLDLGANNVTVSGALSNDGVILVSGAGRPNKGDSDSGIVRYTIIGGVVSELGATDYFNLELVPASAGSFTTGGVLAVAGALTLNTFATLDLGANNVTVSGALSNDGTILVSGAGRPNKMDVDSGIVQYAAAGGPSTITDFGVTDYFNLELVPASAGSFTTSSALAVAGALTLNNFATLDLGANNVTVTGALSNDGTILVSGAGRPNKMDVDSGLVRYVAAVGPTTIADFGVTDYFNLELAPASAGSFTTGGALAVAGALTLNTFATLDLGANNVTVSGALSNDGTILVSGAGRPDKSDSDSGIVRYTTIGGVIAELGTPDYFNLELAPASAGSFTTGGALAVAGALTLNTFATLDLGANNATVTGAFSNDGIVLISGTGRPDKSDSDSGLVRYTTIGGVIAELGTPDYFNLELAPASAGSFTTGGALAVAGALTLNTFATLDLGANNVTVTGALSNDGTILISGAGRPDKSDGDSGIVRYTTIGGVIAELGTPDYFNLELAPASAGSFTTGGALAIAGALSLNNFATLDLGANNVTVTGALSNDGVILVSGTGRPNKSDSDSGLVRYTTIGGIVSELGATDYFTLELAPASAGSFTTGGALAIAGALSLNSFATLDLGANNVMVTGALSNDGTILISGNGRPDKSDSDSGLVRYTTIGGVVSELGATDYFNLELAPASAGSFTTGGVLAVAGALSLNTFATLDLGANNVTVIGALSNDGIALISGAGRPNKSDSDSGLVRYTTIGGGIAELGTPDYFNLELAPASAGSFMTGGALAIAGALTLNTFATLDLGANNVAVTGALSNDGVILVSGAGRPNKSDSDSGLVRYTTIGGVVTELGTPDYFNLELAPSSAGSFTTGGALAVAGALTLNSFATLDLGANNVTVTGTLSNDGIVLISGTGRPDKSDSDSGIVRYTSLGGAIAELGVTDYFNLELAPASAGSFTTGGDLAVAGALSLNNFATLDLGANNVTVSGALSNDGLILVSGAGRPNKSDSGSGIVRYTSLGGAIAELGVTDYFNLELAPASAGSFTTGGALAIAGALTLNTFATLDLGANNVTVSGALSNDGTILISGNGRPNKSDSDSGIVRYTTIGGVVTELGTPDYFNLELAPASAGSFTTGGALAVAGALTLNNFATLDLGANNVTVTGALSNDGTILISGAGRPDKSDSDSGIVRYTTIGGAIAELGTPDYFNLELAPASAGSFTTGGALAVAGALSLNTFATLDLGANNVTVSGALSNDGTILVSGAGRPDKSDNDSGLVRYATIGGVVSELGATDYFNLELAPASAGSFTTSGALAVAGALTLNTFATLDLGANNVTVSGALSNDGTILISGAGRPDKSDSDSGIVRYTTIGGAIAELGTPDYFNLELAPASAGSFTTGGALAVAGALSLNTFATLDLGANNATVTGALSNDGIVLISGAGRPDKSDSDSGIVRYTTIGGVIAELGVTDYFNLELVPASAGSFTTGGALAIAGALTLNTFATLDLGANNVTVTGALSNDGIVLISDTGRPNKSDSDSGIVRYTTIGGVIAELGTPDYFNLELVPASAGSFTTGGALAVAGALTFNTFATLDLGANNVTVTGALSNDGIILISGAGRPNKSDNDSGIVRYTTIGGGIAELGTPDYFNLELVPASAGSFTTGGALAVAGALSLNTFATLDLGANNVAVAGALSNDGVILVSGAGRPDKSDSDSGIVRYTSLGGAIAELGVTDYFNLELAPASAGSFTTGGALAVAGALSLNTFATLDLGANNVTVSGALSNDGVILVSGTGRPNKSDSDSGLVRYTIIGGAISELGVTDYFNLELAPASAGSFTTGGALAVAGALTLNAFTTLDLGANNVTVTGALSNDGIVLISDTGRPNKSDSDSGIVRYTTIGGVVTELGTPDYFNLELVPASAGSFTTGGALAVAGALTFNTFATLDLGANNVTVTGAFSNDGIVLISGTGRPDKSDSDSGLVRYTTIGGVIAELGTPDYFNLELAPASAGSFTTISALAVAGSLSLSNFATLDLGANNVAVTGAFSNDGIVLISGTGRPDKSDSDSGLVRYTTIGGAIAELGATDYFNLELVPASAGSFTTGGALAVAGALTLNTFATLDLGANNVTVSGALSNDGIVLISGAGRPNKSDSDSGIVRYTTIGGVVTELGTPDYFNLELAPASAGSFTMGGALAVAGALSLNTFATLDLGANNVTVSGALSNDGVILVSGAGRPNKSDSDSGLVRYTTIGGVIAELGTPDYFNLELAPASAGSFTTGGALAVAGTLTLNNFATLDLGANNVTVTGALSNDGIVLISGAGRPDKSDSDSGIVRYTTIGGAIAELGVTDYFNLELVPASAGSFTTGGALAIAGALTLNSFATLDLGANNVTVSGALSNDGVILVSGAGRPNKSDNDSGLVRYTTLGGVIAELGTPDYFNLELAPASAGSFTTGGALAVAGALSLNNFATLDLGANNVTVTGALSSDGIVRISGAGRPNKSDNDSGLVRYTTLGGVVTELGATDYFNLELVPASAGSFTTGGALAVAGALSLNTFATLDLGANNVAVTGALSNDGVILVSGAGSPNKSDSNSGLVRYTSLGGAIAELGATDYFNLELAPASAGSFTTGGALAVAGALSLNNFATLDLGANNVTVSGALSNDGVILVSGTGRPNKSDSDSGLVRYTTIGGVVSELGATDYFNLELAPASAGSFTTGGALAVAGALSLNTFATLDLGANNVTVVGALSNDGTILISGAGRPDKSDGDSGIVRYTTIGGAIAELGATDYFNLELAPSSAGSFTTGGAMAIAGALTLNNFATLDLGANNVTVTGALSNDGTILISGAGRPDKSDGDSGIVRYTTIGGVIAELGTPDYFNLELAPASAGSFTTGGALAVAGALTLNTFATLDLGANNVTVTGALSNDGTILISGNGRPNKSDSDSGIVRYTTIGGAIAEFGTPDYFNLELAPASAGSFTTGGALAVAGALTLNSFATLDLGANNVTVTGAFSNDGIVLISGAGRPNKSDSDSGVVRYTTIGGAIAELGVTDYFNLELVPASAGSFTTGGALAVAGALTLNTFATLDLGANGVTVSGTTTLNGALDAGSGAGSFAVIGGAGTLNASSGTTEISGNLSVTNFNHGNGTLKFTGGSQGAYSFYDLIIEGPVSATGDWTVNRNWTYTSGPFAPGSSAVIFAGADTATISGSTSFYDFESTAAGKTIRFADGTTQTITHALTLEGADGNLLTLTGSGSSGWTLAASGASASLQYLDISYANASTVDLSVANGSDAGNNNGLGLGFNWNFGAIAWDGSSSADTNTGANWSTGVVPGQYDAVTVPSTATAPTQPVQNAAMSLKALTLAAGSSWSNGGYNLAIGSGGLANSGSFTYTGTGSLTGMPALFGGSFIYAGGAVGMLAGTTDYTNLAVSGGTITAIDVTVSGILSVSGGNLILPGAVSLSLNDLSSSGTITNAGANTIYASGDVTIGGSFGTPANSTLVMSGAAASLSASVQIGNVQFTSTATGAALAGTDLNLAGDLVLDASSTLSAGNIDIAVGGTTTIGGSLDASLGTLSLLSDDLEINTTTGSIAGGASRIVLAPFSAGRAVDIGTNTAGKLGLSSAELARITTTGVLQIGSAASTGGMVISAPIGGLGVPILDLESGGTGIAGGANTLTVGQLVLRTVGPQTVSLTTAVSGFASTASAGAQSLSLNNSKAGGLTIGSVDSVVGISSNGGSVAVTESLGLLSVNGAIAATGGLSLSGSGIAVSGSPSLDAGGGSISLDANGGSISLGTSSLQTTNAGISAVSIVDASTLALGNLSAPNGRVTIGSSGDIVGATTQNPGTLIQAGSLAGSTAASVGLGNANAILSVAGFTTNGAAAASFSLATSGALTIDGSISTGGAGANLSLEATGISIAGGASLAAPGADILLDLGSGGLSQAAGAGLIDANGLAILSTGGAAPYSFPNANSVGTIAASTQGGAFSFRNAGRALDIGTVGATSGITTSGQNLSLSTTGSGSITVSQAVATGAGHISLSPASGGVFANAAALTTTAGLKLGGVGSFLLDNSGNSLAVLATSTSGGPLTIHTTGALAIGTVNGTSGIASSGQDLSLVATGAITQSEAIVLGAANLSAQTRNNAGASITLDKGAAPYNEAAGLLLESLDASATALRNGALSYRDGTGFSVVAARSLGDLSLQGGGAATHDLSQSGDIVSGGTFAIVAGSGDAIFDRPTNAFFALSVASAAALALDDADGYSLAGQASGAVVAVTEAGALIVRIGGLSSTGGGINLQPALDLRLDGPVATNAAAAHIALDPAAGSIYLGNAITPLVSALDADITLSRPVILQADATLGITETDGAVHVLSFADTVEGAFALDASHTSANDRVNTVFSGILGSGIASPDRLASLTVSGAASATLDSVFTSGAQSISASAIALNGASYRSTSAGYGINFGGPVSLTADALVATNGSNSADDIVFGSSIDGAWNLSLNAGALGAINVAGTIGTSAGHANNLASLLLSNAASATLASVFSSGGQSITAGAISLGGSDYANANPGFGIAFNGPVVLASNIRVATNGTNAADDISFASTIDGAFALALDAGASGGISLAGTVGTSAGHANNLASLSLDAAASAALGSVYTTGAQSYNASALGLNGTNYTSTAPGSGITFDGPVLLGSGIIVATNDGGIHFSSAVEPSTASTEGLSLLAGTGAVSLDGLVGAIKRLGPMTVTSGTFSLGAAAQLWLGTTLTVTGNMQNGGLIEIGSGTALFNADFDSSSGTLNGSVAFDPDIEFRGNVIFAAFTHNGDRLIFSGGTSSSLEVNGQALGPVLISKTGAAGLTVADNVLQDFGDLELASGFLDLDVNGAGWLMDAVGPVIADAFIGRSGSLNLAAGTALRAGNVTSEAGHTIDNLGANTIIASGDVQLDGTFTNPGNSTLVMIGSAASLSSTQPLGNLHIGTIASTTPAALLSTVSLGSDLTLAGNFEIRAEGALDGNTRTIDLAGDWRNWAGSWTPENAAEPLSISATRFEPGTGEVRFTKASGTVHVYGDNRWYRFVAESAGIQIEFEKGKIQRILSGGAFRIQGLLGTPIVLTRLDPDQTSALAGYPPGAPDPNEMWRIDLLPGATLDMQYVEVRYSDARLHPLTKPADVNLYETPGNDPTCYKWIASILAVYSFTEDSNGNGKIDRIRVTAETVLNYDFSNFTVLFENNAYELDLSKGSQGLEAKTDSPAPYVDTEFYIWLEEKSHNDTGVRIGWEVAEDESLRSLQDLATGTFALRLMSEEEGQAYFYAWDSAPPRAAYTLALQNSDEVFFHFSEPVSSTDAGLTGGLAVLGSFTGASGLADASAVADGSEILASYGSNWLLTDLAGGAASLALVDLWDRAETPNDYSIDPAWAAHPLPAPYNAFGAEGPGPSWALDWPNPIASDAFPTPNDNDNPSASHRASDLLVSVPPSGAYPTSYFVWPIWARDQVQPDLAESQYEALTPEESAKLGPGLIRDFTGGQWLRDQDLTLQARVGSALSPTDLRLRYDSGISAEDRATSANGPLGLWLPDFDEKDFSGMVPAPVGGTGAVDGAAQAASLWNFSLPGSDPKVKPDTSFEFFFEMLPALANPLYVGRLDIDEGAAIPADWYRRVKPFGFGIRNVSLQRGSVTVLNNVIDSSKGETVRLSYQIAEPGTVTITVFTLDGDVVQRLFMGSRAAGDFTASWDGRNLGGSPVARGVYFIRVLAPGIDEIRKVLVVRK